MARGFNRFLAGLISSSLLVTSQTKNRKLTQRKSFISQTNNRKLTQRKVSTNLMIFKLSARKSLKRKLSEGRICIIK